MKRPTFFLTSFLGPPSSPASTHGQCGQLPFLYLTLLFLCVAGRACLSKLTVEGRRWELPKKDDSKNLWASYIFPLRFSPMQLRICYTIPTQCMHTPSQRVQNDLQRTRISRGRIIWLLPTPFPAPSLWSVSKHDRRHPGSLRKRVNC